VQCSAMQCMKHDTYMIWCDVVWCGAVRLGTTLYNIIIIILYYTQKQCLWWLEC